MCAARHFRASGAAARECLSVSVVYVPSNPLCVAGYWPVDKLSGTVEADETYWRQGTRHGPAVRRQQNTVVSLVERDGRVRASRQQSYRESLGSDTKAASLNLRI